MPKKPHGRGHGLPDTRLRKNQCFACGPDNLAGMHLKFTYDKKRKTFVCHFRLDDRYTGPPGHCHGGIIATILDESMGKVNKLRQVVALTSNMTVDYLRPVPLNKPLRVESREEHAREKACEYGRDYEWEGRSAGSRTGVIHFSRRGAHVRRICEVIAAELRSARRVGDPSPHGLG
jgi:uncharacterized protein (TIGR00369 family)